MGRNINCQNVTQGASCKVMKGKILGIFPYHKQCRLLWDMFGECPLQKEFPRPSAQTPPPPPKR